MTWATAWVLGLAALAPWVSHVLAGAPSGAFTTATVWLTQAVCTAQNSEEQPADSQGWQAHCPMCVLPQLGLPPVPEQSLQLPSLPSLSLLPTLFLHASSPLFAWITPPSRAPPSLVA